MFMANYGACIALSMAFMEGSVGETMSNGNGNILVLGCITGILYLGGFVMLKYNIRHNGLVLASTFMKLGVLIPTVMAVVVFGLLIGVPNYFSARFLLLALGSVDAVIAYPVYSVATLIAITLIGLLCFHEKLNRKKTAALLMIVAALCLLNL